MKAIKRPEMFVRSFPGLREPKLTQSTEVAGAGGGGGGTAVGGRDIPKCLALQFSIEYPNTHRS